MIQIRDIEREERKAIGVGYFKNFDNKYWGGISGYVFRSQDPKPLYNFEHQSLSDNNLSQLFLLFENKFRLTHRPQNRRLTTLLSLNAGYMVDMSHASFEPTTELLDVEYEEASDGLILQAGLTFRVNPDNNSGFMIEPGITFAPKNIKQYSAPTDQPDAVYLGYYRQTNALFTLKLGYFF